jgi:hypothetical protein
MLHLSIVSIHLSIVSIKRGAPSQDTFDTLQDITNYEVIDDI